MKRIAFLFFFFFLLSPHISLMAQDKEKQDSVIIVKPIVAEAESAAPEMTVADNKLQVKNAPVGKRIEIITILGNKIKEIDIKSADFEYPLNLPKAIYIFRMDGTVRKFVLK